MKAQGSRAFHRSGGGVLIFLLLDVALRIVKDRLAFFLVALNWTLAKQKHSLPKGRDVDFRGPGGGGRLDGQAEPRIEFVVAMAGLVTVLIEAMASTNALGITCPTAKPKRLRAKSHMNYGAQAYFLVKKGSHMHFAAAVLQESFSHPHANSTPYGRTCSKTCLTWEIRRRLPSA